MVFIFIMFTEELLNCINSLIIVVFDILYLISSALFETKGNCFLLWTNILLSNFSSQFIIWHYCNTRIVSLTSKFIMYINLCDMKWLFALSLDCLIYYIIRSLSCNHVCLYTCSYLRIYFKYYCYCILYINIVLF